MQPFFIDCDYPQNSLNTIFISHKIVLFIIESRYFENNEKQVLSLNLG
jgi:hypothetical protein